MSMCLWMSLVMIGLHGEFGDTVFRGRCQREGYFKAGMRHARLINYVISTSDVQSLEDCVSTCLSDGHCSSFNFQVSGFPPYKCELNSKSRSSSRPGSLVRDDKYEYYEIGECEQVIFEQCIYITPHTHR